jgi:hypothetical protein
MEASKLAQRFVDRQAFMEFHPDEEREIGNLGCVVVLGTIESEVRAVGAIAGTIDAMGDTFDFFINQDGVLPDHSPRCTCGQCNPEKAALSKRITARRNVHPFLWQFQTEIPHARFVTFNNGRRHCKAIIFNTHHL